MDKYSADAPRRVEMPAADSFDDLGAVSVTIARLRRFLTDPPTPAEDAEARRRADGIADQICRKP